MSVIVSLFVGLVGLVVMIYAGYPMMLAAGLLGRRRPPHRAEFYPMLSILVPAHNEEHAIEAKLKNLLAAEYPKEKLEILVGDDGSTDATASIVREFASRGVKLVSGKSQGGKSMIQNLMAEQARGEILVFTDADVMLSPQALSYMTENFVDPSVGVVTCSPRFSNEGENQISGNEGMYWRYETWIRRAESDVGLLTVASGSLFSVRREIWKPLNPDVGDDFALPLASALAGYRNVVDERMGAVTRLTQVHPRTMFRMKMRIISKDLRGLLMNRRVLNPLTQGRVAIGLWLHKLLRWMVPYFLLAILACNLLLLARPGMQVVLAMQMLFYLVAFCCWRIGADRVRAPWSIALSFCLVNLAALAGTLHFAAGRRMGTWKPVR